MPSVRVIPRLDIKGSDLVKGIQLEGLRVLGCPEQFARHYYETGADELIYLDVVASLYGRNSLLDIVTRTSRELFIPLTVGGGIRSVEDVRAALCAGADKVALNTAAVRRPELIREAAQRFGSSTIVLSIEAKHTASGYEAYTEGGRERTGLEVVRWAKQATELGAGEILLIAIDRDGTGSGFDLELVRSVCHAVSVPVIASGGAGTLCHVCDVVGRGADAVGLGAILHYAAAPELWSQREGNVQGNVDFLSAGRRFGRIEPARLEVCKQALDRAGWRCRPADEANL
jgi:imidazole glycerol-phosphate synthase subunit HisF